MSKYRLWGDLNFKISTCGRFKCQNIDFGRFKFQNIDFGRCKCQNLDFGRFKIQNIDFGEIKISRYRLYDFRVPPVAPLSALRAGQLTGMLHRSLHRSLPGCSTGPSRDWALPMCRNKKYIAICIYVEGASRASC